MRKVKGNLLVVSLMGVAVIFAFSAIAKAKAENGQGNGNNKSNSSNSRSSSSTNNNQGQGQNKAKNQETIGVGNTSPTEDDTDTNQNGQKNNFGQANAAAHRSVVANFVKSLLEVAKNEDNTDEKGIGQQVRTIAMQQNQGEATTVTAMEQVQTRSKIKTFLFGSDYKNLGALRSEMVQTRNRIAQLMRLAQKTENADDKAALEQQISQLNQEQAKINDFITTNENKISLFGWLFKLFGTSS